MGSLLVSFGLAAALLAQVETDAPASPEAIERAIIELGHDQFSVRQQASQLLREMGLPAEAALNAAAGSDDAEVRMRARAILNDFRYGILPGVPAETVELIIRFRDGDLQQRRDVFQQLAKRGGYETLTRLLPLETDADARRQIIASIFRDAGAIVELLDHQRLSAVLQQMLEESQPEVRQQLLRMVSMPAVVERLAGDSGWEQVLKFVCENVEADEQGTLFRQLFTRTAVVTSLLEKRGLDGVLKLPAQCEDDAATRGRLLGVLVNTNAVYEHLRQTGKSNLAVKLAQDETDRDARREYLRGLMAGHARYYLLNDAEDRRQLWMLIKADSQDEQNADRNWHLQASLPLLQMYSSTTAELIRDQADAEWLMSLLGQSPDERRGTLLEQLLAAHTLPKRLIQHGAFDQLLATAQRQEPEQRGRLLGQLAALPDTIQYLAAEERLPLLISLAQQESDARARKAYLQMLLRSPTAMSELMNLECYEPLLALARSEVDDDARAAILGAFVHTEAVVRQVVKNKQLEFLIQLAQDSQPKPRRILLDHMFASLPAITALLADGHYETLLALAEKEEDEKIRAALLAAFYSQPPTIDQVVERKEIDRLIDLARRLPDEGAQYVLLHRFFANSNAMSVMVAQGRLHEIVQLAGLQEKQVYWRATLLQTALASPLTVQFLAERDELKQLFELIESEPELVRERVYDNLVNREETITLIVEKAGLDGLLGVARQLRPLTRGRATGLLLNHATVLKQLVADDRLELLLTTAAEESDDIARRQYLAYLFMNSPAMTQLLNLDCFDRLLALAKSVESATERAELLGSFAQCSAVVRHLSQRQQMEMVVDFANDVDDANRSYYLQRLFSGYEAMAELIRCGHYETLLELAERDSDTDERRRKTLLSTFYGSPAVINELAVRKQIDLLLKLVAESPSYERHTKFLRTVIHSPNVLQAVIDAGRFDELHKLTADLPASAQMDAAFLMLSSRATVASLRQCGHLEQVIHRFTGSGDPNVRRRFLYMLLYNSSRAWLLEEAKLGDELAVLIKSVSDQSQRRQHVRQVLTDRTIQQRLINNGQAGVIYAMAKLEPEAGFSQESLRRVLYAPQGVAAFHLRQGEHDEALRLLEQDATDDAGLLRLASHLLLAGGLDERIAETKKRLAAAANPEDFRRLVWLLRAAGDLTGARQAAEKADDIGLVKALAVEQADWNVAARIQAGAPCPLPVPLSGHNAPPSPQDERRLRAEQLGLLAAYQRLAGDDEALGKTVAELRQLAAGSADDSVLRWACIEALMINNQPDDGLKLLAESYPTRAFDLWTWQHRYGQAFALANWPDDSPPDRAWLDSLPSDADPSQPEFGRLEFALRIAHTLQWLGRRESADQIIALLEVYADEQPDFNGSASPRRRCWDAIGLRVLKMGRTDQAWQIAARSWPSPSSPPTLMSHLDASRWREVQGWWQVLRRRNPAQSLTDTMAGVYRILNPPADEDPAEFLQLAADAEALASQTSSWRDTILTGVGETCLRRGELELAKRLIPAYSAGSDVLLADAYWSRQQWTDAAERFQAIWQADHDKLGALYLAGAAWDRAGREAEGRQLKQQASLLALDSVTRANWPHTACGTRRSSSSS